MVNKCLKMMMIFVVCAALAAGCSTPREVKDAPVTHAIEGVEIAGYCPVAYVEANKPVKGTSEHVVVREGRTYWFVDEGAKRAYEQNPTRYEVMYRGWDATALGRGERVASDATLFTVYEGRIYLFATTTSREAFLADPAAAVSAADAAWQGAAVR